MVTRPDEDVDLAGAALLIAREEYPALDARRYLGQLDAMAAEMAGRVGPADDEGARTDALARYLFGDQGFQGNTQEYYDPRNSFLNEVLDRRLGIPITLSTVFIEVARRMGLAAAGVALPGHFIVKVTTRGGDVLLDPFHGGQRVSETDCQDRLDRIFGGGKVRVEAPMLAACGRKQILARMLRNLKVIYTKAGEHTKALGVIELLLRLEPRSGEELRDRGLLYAALDCYALASQDLETYLSLVPGTPEADEILQKTALLRQKAARLN